jgi:DNA-binding NtrC family response regulator
MDKKATILVVDDEHGVRQSFDMVLSDDYEVLLAATGKEAIDVFNKNSIDLILLDIRLPDIDGLDLLVKLKEIDPNNEVIMVTAVREIQSAVRAIKAGAYEYIIKPFEVDEVLTTINRALEKRHLVKEVLYLRDELERHHPFEEMVSESENMKRVFDLIATVSKSDGTVLIQGESGTGKELVARAIHNLSPRSHQPLVVINCAVIPAALMESEIFGHNKGAFTGADKARIGKLEIADKGTVFLDDIDAAETNMQAKLLRVIQEKEFERLGGAKVLKADVRFVAASNKVLKDLISKNQFREDLYYRLNVFPITLPPLRERKSDIPLLLNHFLEILAKKSGQPSKRFSDRATKVLIDYDWPGNVRELQNIVQRLFTTTKGAVIRIKDISPFDIDQRDIKDVSLKEAVNLFEQQYIAEALDQEGGNRNKAAERLGIHRNTLRAKIDERESNLKS